MPTATSIAVPGSPRFSDVSDPAPGPEEPLVHQASGRNALRTATRQTDERGQPLSIFTAHRHEKVEILYGWRELEAAVQSWSPTRS